MKKLFTFLFIILSINVNGQQHRETPILIENSNQCENHIELYKYKGHLIYKIDCDSSCWGIHSPNCPICSNTKISLKNILELSQLSYQCQTYVKEYKYDNHIICRVNCSGSYWGFHSPTCNCLTKN